MNTIYDIYEGRLYQSLLANTKTKVSNTPNVLKDIMNTFKERFIKIVKLSAKLTDEQEDLFYELVENAISYNNAKYIECNFPLSLKTYLISVSNNALSKKDFSGFPHNKKEWEFKTSVWRTHLISVDERLNIKNLSTIPENKIINYTYNVLRCGNTVIVQGKNNILIWVDGMHKIFGYFTDVPKQNCVQLDYVFK